MVREHLSAARAGRMMPFVIEYDGVFVGAIAVNNIVWGSAYFASVGYWIDQAVAGRGIMPRAVAMGLFSKKDFQQKIDWPMIFFLLSLDGLSRSISYLGLDTALAHSVGNGFAFVDGRQCLVSYESQRLPIGDRQVGCSHAR